jgi:hypothetical protein
MGAHNLRVQIGRRCLTLYWAVWSLQTSSELTLRGCELLFAEKKLAPTVADAIFAVGPLVNKLRLENSEIPSCQCPV